MGWIKPKNQLKLLSIILEEAILFAVVSFGPPTTITSSADTSTMPSTYSLLSMYFFIRLFSLAGGQGGRESYDTKKASNSSLFHVERELILEYIYCREKFLLYFYCT